jgi:hypothetical protein
MSTGTFFACARIRLRGGILAYPPRATVHDSASNTSSISEEVSFGCLVATYRLHHAAGTASHPRMDGSSCQLARWDPYQPIHNTE